MKKHTTIRDQLYVVLDGLISSCKAMNRSLPAITLSAAQFQIFKQFNKPTKDGNYYYHDIIVKSLNSNVR